MAGIGQSSPGITSPGTPISIEDPGGSVVAPGSTTIQFTGAVTVLPGGPGEIVVNIGAVGTFMATDFSNADPAANAIDLGGFQINNVADPTLAQDAATKAYVDAAAAGFMNTDFSNAVNAANAINMGANFINNVLDPVLAQDAATKAYVDAIAPASSWQIVGNTLVADGSLGTINNFDVLFIQNNVEFMKLVNGTGITMNLGAYEFNFGTNTLFFGTADTGGSFTTTGNGSFARGVASAGTVEALGEASTAFGRGNGGGSLLASGSGSMVSGSAQTAGSVITATSDGSTALGNTETAGVITVSGIGALGFGFANLVGLIQSLGEGALAFGRATSDGVINATGLGCLAHGSANGATSTIQSNAVGATAFGTAASNGQIVTTGIGAVAFGNSTTSSSILTTGNGSLAFGNSINGNTISSDGLGSLAGGNAVIGNISVAGQGAIAFGDDMTSTAEHSQSFGVGHDNSSFVCMAIGQYSVATGTPGTFIATDPAFVIGNGVVGVPANAFQIDKDGKQYETGANIVPARLVLTTGAISDRTDRKLVVNDTGGGVNTLTLPTGVTGLTYDFGVASTNTGTWTLSPSGGDTIDANVDATLAVAQQVTFIAGVWYRV